MSDASSSDGAPAADSPAADSAVADSSVAMVAEPFPVVGAVVASAVSAAEKRASPADVAYGVVAALRRLRAAADEEAGYAMAAAVDTAIRRNLLAGSLAELRRTGRNPPHVVLPTAGPGAASAAAIMESAADSCLAINAYAPDNGPFEAAVGVLTHQIGRHLDGEPAWESVERELHRPAAQSGGFILPLQGATVH